ncbi:MAG: zinc dependent phospholipase C family protein [Lachnospiraceae bacterium]|nr:zinc dependent phospholipase C family protein [Lachnospiraceae bacterium]
MPGFRTHYLWGQAAKGQDIIRAIQKYEHSFNLGLQGPDIFFYSPLAHLLYEEHLGGQLHNGTRTNAMFLSLFEARDRFHKKEDREICDAYICGFIGHYTLDSVVHPYVHYRTKKVKNAHLVNYTFGIHVLLETDMDARILRHYLGKKTSEFHCAATIALSKKEQAVVSRLLSLAVETAYPAVHLSPRLVSFAIFCIRIGNSLLHDTTGRRKAFLRRFDERLIGNSFLSSLIAADFHKTYTDPCNLRHKTWRNPWNLSITSQESVFDLMDRATVDFRKRLYMYRKMIRKNEKNRNQLLKHLGNLSYDSGLTH